MKKNNTSLFSFLACILFLVGCTDKEQQKKEANLASGQTIVKKNCLVCHAQGINGAPIIGNKKMWRPRIGKGQDALVQSAINGFGLMPAKGGKTQLTDDEIQLAVAYMINQVNND